LKKNSFLLRHCVFKASSFTDRHFTAMWTERSVWNTVACPLRGTNLGLLSVHGLQADERAPIKILFWFWFCSPAFKTTPTLHMHRYEAIQFLTASAIDSEVFGYSLKEGAFHISFLNCLLCLGSGVIEFSTPRAESNDVCVLRYTSIRSPPRCVSRVSCLQVFRRPS